MTSRERLLAALDRNVPDRLPVTTHHLMSTFLSGPGERPGPREFFDRFGFDRVTWVVAHCPDKQAGEGGGYILAFSDHVFEADPVLLTAPTMEARACHY